jgi:hypothetical protein
MALRYDAIIILVFVLASPCSAAASGGNIRVLADPDTPQVRPVLTELRSSADDTTLVVEGLDSLGGPRSSCPSSRTPTSFRR